MSNFNFSNKTLPTASGKSQLEANAIHTVTFTGCEAKDIEKDGSVYKTIKIRFDNSEGYFEDTIFEPKGQDFERSKSDLGYEQPSNVEMLMAKIKHLIDGVNPDLGKKIDSGETSFNANSWDDMRTLIIRSTNKGKGVETSVKLLSNKDGYPVFPRYIVGISREGNTYLKTKFIGSNLKFTAKEEELMAAKKEAKPTDMNASRQKGSAPTAAATTAAVDSLDDLDF